MSNYFDSKELFSEPQVSQHGSHMVMTNVQKATKHKRVNIDTRFRDDYNSNKTANYTITLPDRINDVKNLRITTLELPLTFSNISTNFGNNTITINSNRDSYKLTIPDGIYDMSGLALAINGQLQTSGPLFSTITFQIVNNFASFRSSNMVRQFTFVFDTSPLGIIDQNTIRFSLGWLLGFRSPNILLDKSTTIVSTAIVDINGPRYLYLALDEFSKGNQNSFVSLFNNSALSKNILARITFLYTIYQRGGILCASYQNGLLQSDRRSYTGKVDLQRFNIQLVNEIGNPVDLNGLDFSFLLDIEHE
jgi:hypothetical protein